MSDASFLYVTDTLKLWGHQKAQIQNNADQFGLCLHTVLCCVCKRIPRVAWLYCILRYHTLLWSCFIEHLRTNWWFQILQHTGLNLSNRQMYAFFTDLDFWSTYWSASICTFLYQAAVQSKNAVCAFTEHCRYFNHRYFL